MGAPLTQGGVTGPAPDICHRVVGKEERTTMNSRDGPGKYPCPPGQSDVPLHWHPGSLETQGSPPLPPTLRTPEGGPSHFPQTPGITPLPCTSTGSSTLSRTHRCTRPLMYSVSQTHPLTHIYSHYFTCSLTFLQTHSHEHTCANTIP